MLPTSPFFKWEQEEQMLTLVKMALRISTTAYDDELENLIDAAKLDLEIAGANWEDDAICRNAIITYCKMNFGSPDNYERLKASYDEQKAQLRTATGYTEWGDDQ